MLLSASLKGTIVKFKCAKLSVRYLYAIPYYEKDSYPELFDEMFRQRHQIFVEGRGWKELGKVDGREIDQFDTTNAIYIVALGADGQLQGSIRVKPTTGPTILEEVFPRLCTKRKIPKKIETWEMSRLLVCHHSEMDDAGVRIKGKLICAMYEFCMNHGIETVTAIGDTFFLPRLMKAGVEAIPFGLPQKYDTGEMVALELTVNAECLQNMRGYYRIPENALTSDLSLPNPDSSDHIADLPSQQNLVALKDLTRVIGRLRDPLRKSARAQYVVRFTELVKRLGTGDKVELKKAEQELDQLTQEVRETLYGGETSLNDQDNSKRLQ